MATEIGIIAEDSSDVDALYQFACKLGDEASFKFRKFVGHGCSKLRRKCRAWAFNLKSRGCKYLIVAHDLDQSKEAKLRAELESLVSGIGFSSHLILIPVRELEAWLLCDGAALKTVFRTTKTPAVPSSPELVLDPKDELRKLVRKFGGPTYINTVHNKRIAKESRIENIARKCPSFKAYVSFMRAVLK